MKPPLLNFEIFWKDLDQKTPEKRPKTRSKFVKSTNSCHLEFSSSFWCVVFSLFWPLILFFSSEPKHKPIWSPLENQVFKRFFFSSNGFFWSGFSFWIPDLWFHKFFLAFMAFLFWLFLFFLRCTTQLQLTAAHSTTAYRPQSFDEITQSVWSERYKYSKVFGFNWQIILKYSIKKTKQRLFWLRMYRWYLCSFCLDKTKWEGESWVSWESRQSFNRFLQKNVPIS